MNFEEYVNKSKRTRVDLGSVNANISHMLLGIGGEYLKEFLPAATKKIIDRAEVLDESGDILWYLANYCDLSKAGFYILKPDQSLTLGECIGILLEEHKKDIAYGKKSDGILCQTAVSTILSKLDAVFKTLDSSLEEVFDLNIAKLKIRFPDQFSSDLAINKDKSEEDKVFKNE